MQQKYVLIHKGIEIAEQQEEVKCNIERGMIQGVEIICCVVQDMQRTMDIARQYIREGTDNATKESYKYMLKMLL